MGARTLVTFASTLLITAAVSVQGELNLTPHPTSYELDGARFEQLSFDNGTAKPATYAAPRGWRCSGATAALTLHPPGKTQAEATISRVIPAKPIAFDEEGMKQLADDVMLAVPKESTKVTLVSQTKNPLLIERKETFLVVVSYIFGGQSFEHSVMYLNRGQDQIRFELVARQADFAELQKAFVESLFTWQNL